MSFFCSLLFPTLEGSNFSAHGRNFRGYLQRSFYFLMFSLTEFYIKNFDLYYVFDNKLHVICCTFTLPDKHLKSFVNI